MKAFIAMLCVLIVCCLVFVFVSSNKRTVPASIIIYFDLNHFTQYCPPTTGLTFTALNLGGAGIITGRQNGVNFSSLLPNEPSPQKLSGNIIQDVQPYSRNGMNGDNRNGMYGAQTGNRISCYYQYTNSLNRPVNLIMTGLTTN